MIFAHDWNNLLFIYLCKCFGRPLVIPTVFLCWVAAFTASGSLPLYSHKKGCGPLDFMAIEGCQERTAGQTDFSACKISLSISPPLSMPSGACSKQLTQNSQRDTGRSGSFHCCPNNGLNHQRAAAPEQSAKYEHGLRDFCFFPLHRLDSETYHIPACAAQGLCALNYTYGNHGEMHGPISYE